MDLVRYEYAQRENRSSTWLYQNKQYVSNEVAMTRPST